MVCLQNLETSQREKRRASGAWSRKKQDPNGWVFPSVDVSASCPGFVELNKHFAVLAIIWIVGLCTTEILYSQLETYLAINEFIGAWGINY